MNWKIGEVVVGICTCVIKGTPPVKKDYRYVIQNIYYCPKCKEPSFDVGFVSTSGGPTKCGCNENIPMNEIHWASYTLFKKLETRSKEERLEEALKKEDYILAKLIREES